MVDREERDDPEDGVLDPEDVEVERREEVETLGENRYVVSTDAGDASDDADTGSTAAPPSESASGGRAPDSSAAPTDTPDRVAPSAARTPIGAVGERYAVDVAATVDGSVADTRIASDSIVETFEELLVWYAEQVDASTPSEEVIRILLAESDLDVSLLE